MCTGLITQSLDDWAFLTPEEAFQIAILVIIQDTTLRGRSHYAQLIFSDISHKNKREKRTNEKG